jgi:hypothetical protein
VLTTDATVGAQPSAVVPPRSLVRRTLVWGFALLLTWLILAHTIAGALSRTSPEFVLKFLPHHGAALSAVVEAAAIDRLKLPASASMPILASMSRLSESDIRAYAEAAVVGDPLDARAVRTLAQLVELAGDTPRAAALYRASSNLSIRDSFSVFWLMREAIKNGNHRVVAHSIDTLLRTNSQVAAEIYPELARLAERPNGMEAVAEVLAEAPPWRTGFFNVMTPFIRDARTPLELMQKLRDTSVPPTDKEVLPYVKFLVSKGFYELAYYTWLQFIPPEQLGEVGYLFNGNFRRQPTGSPFDWYIVAARGAITDIVRRDKQPDQNTLYLELGPGRVEFNVEQTLLLPPGSYVVSGELFGRLIGKRGLRWRVGCPGSQALGESEQLNGSSPQWGAFEFKFTVPADSCRAQVLSLVPDSRSASEQLMSGKIQFANLAVRPASPAP